MSANTKQILAITLGSLGLVLGIVGTITAYNAKKATQDDVQVTSLVQDEFAKAQAAQDVKDQQTRTQAQEFVDTLGGKEKKLLRSINANGASISKNQKTIKKLQKQVASLRKDQAATDSEISSLSSQQRSDYRNLNNKISQTNASLNQLKKNVHQLNQSVDFLEANP